MMAMNFFMWDDERGRKDFPIEIKRKAWQKCKGKCRTCKKKLRWPAQDNYDGKADVHFDHKDGDDTNDSLANCNPLCPDCHTEKSRKDAGRRAERKRNDEWGLDRWEDGWSDEFGF